MAKVTNIGYFPFCLKKGKPPKTGIDTQFPISLPLEKYMTWWWKVKTWKLTGSSTGNERWGSGSSKGYNRWRTTSLTQDTAWTQNIKTEKNLVCYPARIIDHGFTAFSKRSTGDITSTNNSSIFFAPEAYLDEKTIYPKMLLGGWFSTTKGHPKVQASLDPASSLYLDGIKIPCHISWFPGEVNNKWSWSGKQQFDIKPEKYWEFKDE